MNNNLKDSMVVNFSNDAHIFEIHDEIDGRMCELKSYGYVNIDYGFNHDVTDKQQVIITYEMLDEEEM